ncbi:MAG: NTP transferase domain-containing protein [Agriterribacter sp.]
MTLNENNILSLNGLVLAGGKSTRMGSPKDVMLWHGKEQKYYAADLLHPFCEEVFISCREDQQKNIDPAYKTLPDSFLNMGPLGGILSALRSQRDKAWLVIACDLPLLNRETIAFLIANRDTEKTATAYKSPHDGLPEPLITIWEPESYPVMLEFLGRDITCPRKALMNSDVKILQPLQPEALMNVNTPEDAVKAKKIFNK